MGPQARSSRISTPPVAGLGEDGDRYRRLVGPVVQRWAALRHHTRADHPAPPPPVGPGAGSAFARCPRPRWRWAASRTDAARGLLAGSAAHGVPSARSAADDRGRGRAARRGPRRRLARRRRRQPGHRRRVGRDDRRPRRLGGVRSAGAPLRRPSRGPCGAVRPLPRPGRGDLRRPVCGSLPASTPPVPSRTWGVQDRLRVCPGPCPGRRRTAGGRDRAPGRHPGGGRRLPRRPSPRAATQSCPSCSSPSRPLPTRAGRLRDTTPCGRTPMCPPVRRRTCGPPSRPSSTVLRPAGARLCSTSKVTTAADFETYNENYVGGDIAGGAMDRSSCSGGPSCPRRSTPTGPPKPGCSCVRRPPRPAVACTACADGTPRTTCCEPCCDDRRVTRAQRRPGEVAAPPTSLGVLRSGEVGAAATPRRETPSRSSRPMAPGWPGPRSAPSPRSGPASGASTPTSLWMRRFSRVASPLPSRLGDRCSNAAMPSGSCSPKATGCPASSSTATDLWPWFSCPPRARTTSETCSPTWCSPSPGVTAVYERSDLDARKREGLPAAEGPLRGTAGPIEIVEDGLRFGVDPVAGHKTGFYLDQRDARAAVRPFATGRRVLDVFAYTGGFSVAAWAAGAAAVEAIDSSGPALAGAAANLARNGFPTDGLVEADAFADLRRRRRAGERWDLICLDPPKFAPSAAHVDRASRGVQGPQPPGPRPDRARRIPAHLVLLGCGRRGAVPEDPRRRCARCPPRGPDHRPLGPTSGPPGAVSFPEAAYLKGLLCRVVS